VQQNCTYCFTVIFAQKQGLARLKNTPRLVQRMEQALSSTCFEQLQHYVQ
jgi:hypothetical protein